MLHIRFVARRMPAYQTKRKIITQSKKKRQIKFNSLNQPKWSFGDGFACCDKMESDIKKMHAVTANRETEREQERS